MTHAERQARYRASHAGGTPKVVYRRPADHRSRPQRWRDAAAELIELQSEYQAWLDALPENLASSATVGSLQTTCELDLSELASVDPPRGFGRDSKSPGWTLMTIRGGGDPGQNTVIEPFVRMGPLPRSLASEAYGCFMVRTYTGPTEYKVAARGSRALAGSPRIVCYSHPPQRQYVT